MKTSGTVSQPKTAAKSRKADEKGETGGSVSQPKTAAKSRKADENGETGTDVVTFPLDTCVAALVYRSGTLVNAFAGSLEFCRRWVAAVAAPREPGAQYFGPTGEA